MLETFEKDRLSLDEINRYSRHLIVPQIGLQGQLKLKNSKVLVVGTGALGSPVLLYLAAAGVGTLGIIDFDKVEESNLQRQVIHNTNSINRSKVESAKEQINLINPNINIISIEDRLTSNNALEIIKEFDLVVDGTDNFPTRYLINDACVLLHKPFVYGAIFRFEGQVSVFNKNGGACYRCLFKEPPAPGKVQSCAEAGVLGVLPGIVGTIQANEAIKLILNIGESLDNRLLTLNALKMKFFEYKIEKNNECPVCSKNPSIKELIDYNLFCGIEDNIDDIIVDEIDLIELKTILKNEDLQIVDIRENIKEDEKLIKSSEQIDIKEILEDLSILNNQKKVVLVCTIGLKSKEAIIKLKKAGYSGKIYSLKGGITSLQNSIKE
ncbi:molybdopterin-synthase adenylyltransferase MoeB [Arcobacter porcinus]|uniref:molybdopterin-synthase adenylyltransferase MoeB n=1 Tax=Arcobacter porcinus TaxID=1935204 RepID=UPI00081F1F73|nr:molybdopterin-synthase adenylyltransferase MoeB [Arcobacter porcinus]OCL84286.1 putative adenylyltransferase/sulfurtransferase MoeZ [Arcobacter porcinus]OCL84807.1 putative adenylyltransferase/sulfurtransferase MoeZ [Arcobacter porcinus]